MAGIDPNRQLVRDHLALDLIAATMQGLDVDAVRTAVARASMFVPKADYVPLEAASVALAIVAKILSERYPKEP